MDLVALVTTHGAALVFAATLAARAGVPIPAAPLVVVAASLHPTGQVHIATVFLLAVAGGALGDGAWFFAGRRHGYRILKLLCRVSLSPDSCVSQSEAFIGRWGGRSLLAAKFLPGVSVVAPPMAGALGMPVRVFLAYEVLASALWALLFVGLGLVFSNQVQAVLDVLSATGVGALLTLAVVLAAYMAIRQWRRRRSVQVAMPRIDVAELGRLLNEEPAPIVIDVRSREGRSMDPRRIPGALGIALPDVAAWAARLPRERLVVAYCNCPNEASAVAAASVLAAAGFDRVRPLAGGLDAWEAAGYRLERHEGEAPLPAGDARAQAS
ncbi:MAG TPA: VTT domain-containing protein [Albitalea sp.]|uniref:VTT domain-containing protein n=1 Tax=Piscinibacter sp. TaxID=1903157 RepID=UPI002ECFC8BF